MAAANSPPPTKSASRMPGTRQSMKGLPARSLGSNSSSEPSGASASSKPARSAGVPVKTSSASRTRRAGSARMGAPLVDAPSCRVTAIQGEYGALSTEVRGKCPVWQGPKSPLPARTPAWPISTSAHKMTPQRDCVCTFAHIRTRKPRALSAGRKGEGAGGLPVR